MDELLSSGSADINARVIDALLSMPKDIEELDEISFMQKGQEYAENITQSVISFIHFVNDDEESIELVAWSKRTLTEYCHAAYDKHYPVDKAGIWADALRKREAIIINNYEACPHKKGLPQGHAGLNRFLTVPIIENNKVVMLAGVGNKNSDYTNQDIVVVQLIANAIWRLVWRKRNEKALFKLSQALEQSPELIMITDTNCNIEYVNKAFCSTTGYKKAEVMGKNPRILRSGKTSDTTYKDMYEAINQGEIWQGEFINQAKSGNEYIEFAVITPIKDENGVISHFLAVKDDITLKKQLEDELRQKDKLMLSQARHVAMGEMIAMIAHQWRQPLATIGMALNNLKVDIGLSGKVETEVLVETIANIDRLIKYLSTTIDDFRDFFKPDKEMEIITPSKLCANVKNIIGNSLENSQIKMEVVITDDLPFACARRELLQVIINIIQNAKDAILANNTENPKIITSCKQDKGMIVLEISDNGGGISENDLAKVFDPYFTTKGPSSGTGLGLYMSKIIIEQHHKGFISAYNNSDGTTIKIELPIVMCHNL